jgi:MoxR-like ATPase
MAMDAKEVQAFGEKIRHNLEKVIIGKQETLFLTVIGLLCQGHLLIEDVPGVGKTMLARSLAKSLGCSFKRIQFTPDMLPSDVTGVSIYNQNTRDFEFRAGPIMAQIVLADEINRATPKTQSALLEAMEEHQATVDGMTYQLPEPFMILATQNPIEYEGTFPLPEAQLDRFLMQIDLGYTSMANEIHILELQQLQHPIQTLKPVAEVAEIQEMQEMVKYVHVSEPVKEYIVSIVRQTRDHPDVFLGSSPRGSLGLYKAGQARAAMMGRDYVLPDDIKALASHVIAHRVIVNPVARLKDISSRKIVDEIVYSMQVPDGDMRLGD